MSIQPDIQRWERRFMVCVGIVLGAMLAMGARQVGRDLYQRPALVEQARATQRQWSQTLAGELTDKGASDGWLKIAQQAPELMLQACATQTTETR